MKKIFRIFVSLLICQMFMSSIVAQNSFEAAYKNFKPFYGEKLKQHGIIGSSFFLLHDGQTVAKEFYGLQDKDKNIAVNEDTIYHWASITKTFTAIAIMQLRDRGLLKLDDPIVKYLPELREVHNPFGDMNEITLRHLMSHSAGFRAGTWAWGGDKDWHPFEPTRWEQLVAMMPYTEIEFKPGSKFSYSNPGIIFLGRVIEIVTQDNYETYIDKNILKPLEMYRSFFDAAPYHLLKYRSHSYFLEDGKLTEARFNFDSGITVSNGGLNAPLTDMIKYLNFLLGDAKRHDVYEQILKRSSLEEMWQPRVKIEFEIKDRKDAMGLCFFIEDNFGQHFVGHSGTQNGFLSHFYLRPDSRTAYIVAYNTHAVPTEKDKSKDTRQLDLEIKEYLFKNIFPVLAKNN